MSGQVEKHLLIFYGWWQFAVCLFAFLALLSIWYHIGRKQKDYGQLWLALSILCWSFSGAFEVFYAQNNLASSENYSDSFVDVYRSIFSLLNSLFILLALPWFKYIPKKLDAIIHSKYWNFIVGLPFIFSLLPSLSRVFLNKEHSIIIELDVYYALFTLGFLGLVLFESFRKRKLPLLAILSIVCILITLIAEILKLTGSDLNMILLSAIFKTSLIMIFFALAMSWVKELAENIIPTAKDIFLNLRLVKNGDGKFEHIAHVKGFPGKEDQDIKLSPANFKLLELFVKRKLDTDNEWLEIKPKSESRTGKVYDIKDHNEIKRITHSILDGVFGKQMWTKEQHEAPLKSTIFEMSEKRERKIRLKIPADNLSLSQ